MARTKSNMSVSTCATLSSTEKKAPEQTAPEQTAPEERAPEQKAPDDVPSMSPKRLSDDATMVRKFSLLSDVSNISDAEEGAAAPKKGPRKSKRKHGKSVSAARRASVEKALRRAENMGPMFFTGEEALLEVANPDGCWKWALVGPDPDKLPLVGGGTGSVEEMKESIGKYPTCYGLLRMTFGVEAKAKTAKTKFIFVSAADDIDSGNFTARERGQALGVEPAMQKKLYEMSAWTVKVHLHSAEECTVERFIEKIKKEVLGAAQKDITLENFNAAEEYHKQMHPEAQQAEEELQGEVALVEAMTGPLPEAAEPALVPPPPEVVEQEPSRLRTKVKAHRVGDVIEFFSRTQNQWMLDGEVVQVTDETIRRNGQTIVAGSLKVVYQHGSMYEWVEPAHFNDRVQTSARPSPPEPVVGTLQKETHGWFAYRHVRYVELKGGWFRWWDDASLAATGRPESKGLYLFGLQSMRQGCEFTIKTPNSKGAVYKFRAGTEKQADRWYKMLWLHAGFCEEMHEYQAKKALLG